MNKIYEIIIKEITEKFNKIEDLKKEISKINNEIYIIRDKYPINELSYQEIKELANYLYWNFKDLNKILLREKIFNMSGHDFNQLICSIDQNIKCSICNEKIMVASFTKLKELKREKNYICKNCMEKRNKQYNEELKIKQEKEKEEYRKKLDYLKQLKYKDYLKTEHWNKLRKYKLKNSQYKCQICNKRSDLQVHHRTYEKLGEENLSDLIVLCEDCHNLFHSKLESSKNGTESVPKIERSYI